jgi:hypothetical protein
MKAVLGVCIAVWLIAGCDTLPRSKDKELEQVAKDWSMTIRASQVIPVYPLTEDLQPGDVFLVQVPIDRQQAIYKEKGFLPLDNLVDRLVPSGFCTFYGASFMSGGTAACKPLPVTWLTPGQDAAAWAAAPGASFPTYSFSARKGAGFNLAVPVEGVPVGLSLLGGDAAEGSVTITSAKTYGVDTISLYDDLLTWAGTRRSFLANFEPRDKKQNYLRVITRVYLTGGVTVSLQSSRSASGGLSAGAAKPVDLVVPTTGDKPEAVTADAYKAGLDKINETIQDSVAAAAVRDALPGGSVRVVAASANAITLKEKFPRPLVIGYLGFDVAITEGGGLGPPIPTHAVLNNEGLPATWAAAVPSYNLTRMYREIAKRAPTDTRAEKLRIDLNQVALGLTPAKYPCGIYSLVEGSRALQEQIAAESPVYKQTPTFQSLATYRANLVDSIALLKQAASDPAIGFDGQAPRTPETDKKLQSQLECSERALTAVNQGLQKHAALLRRARDYSLTFEP